MGPNLRAKQPAPAPLLAAPTAPQRASQNSTCVSATRTARPLAPCRQSKNRARAVTPNSNPNQSTQPSILQRCARAVTSTSNSTKKHLHHHPKLHAPRHPTVNRAPALPPESTNKTPITKKQPKTLERDPPLLNKPRTHNICMWKKGNALSLGGCCWRCWCAIIGMLFAIWGLCWCNSFLGDPPKMVFL